MSSSGAVSANGSPPISPVVLPRRRTRAAPGAGSDLAAVPTTGCLDSNEWVVTRQKVWASLAMEADRCFVLARTEPGSKRGAGQHP
jgi:hypothetical protein